MCEKALSSDVALRKKKRFESFLKTEKKNVIFPFSSRDFLLKYTYYNELTLIKRERERVVVITDALVVSVLQCERCVGEVFVCYY